MAVGLHYRKINKLISAINLPIPIGLHIIRPYQKVENAVENAPKHRIISFRYIDEIARISSQQLPDHADYGSIPVGLLWLSAYIAEQ